MQRLSGDVFIKLGLFQLPACPVEHCVSGLVMTRLFSHQPIRKVDEQTKASLDHHFEVNELNFLPNFVLANQNLSRLEH